jgi:tRNA A-37 threonylcarbamoyl transferase component Bud32
MQIANKKDNVSLLASFGINTPTISLDDTSTLTSLQVVRSVPKRRCVCKALWQNKTVYAKLFYGEKAAQYALRDVRGVENLQKGKILTPKILKQSKVPQLKAYVVIFEAISPSESAEAIWNNANEFVRIELAHQLVQVVAQHHEAGLLQTDMYLKNFLIQYDSIYTIDGDGVHTVDKLSIKKAQANLCQLLSKLDVLTIDSQLPSLLETYANARPWQPSLDIDAVKKIIEAARQKASSAYADKKVFRQCTDVDVLKTKKAFVAMSAHDTMIDFPQTVVALDGYLNQASLIKDGNTCTVFSAKIGALDAVIKRYNIKGFWHGLGRAFRRTRASISWANAHRLQLLGLPTARPVALVETKWLGLKGKAYFLTAYVDAPDMAQFFATTNDKRLRSEAIKQVVQLFYRLHLLKISHGDMKASNIKVLTDGSPLLIDLDSMRQHCTDSFAQKNHVRDIKRFMQNWKDTPSLYNAFVKVFKVVYVDHAPLQAAQILE